ncbi:MAG: hypothetical protein WA584_09585 [Pyrinomonadaceae bacterium]
MSYSGTDSTTFTTADIGKVFDCFAADLDMLSQSTGLRTRDNARRTAEDVKTMARNGYLIEVDICLKDSYGEIIRAAKYEVSTDASLWNSERPGNNLWPRTPGGTLVVITLYSNKWVNLTSAQQVNFLNSLNGSWGDNDIDISFPGLSRYHDRDYASNGYGARKSVYR